MSKLLLVPALLLAACTDDFHKSDGPVVPDAGAAESTAVAETPDAGTPDAPAPTLRVGFSSEPNACDDNSVRLEALAFLNDTRVFDATCRFTLADGRTFDGCFVTVSIPNAENVTLTVTDPASGVTATHEEVISGPPSFDATLDLVAHDHAFSWAVASQFGAGTNAGDVSIDIDPMQSVVLPDPSALRNFNGTVSVTRLGLYTVTAHASISYGELICDKTVSKTVTVYCDGSAHGN